MLGSRSPCRKGVVVVLLHLVGNIAASTAADASAFIAWLRATPLAAVGPVRIAPSNVGEGVGVFLTADVAEDEVLFKVPPASCVDLDSVAADEDCGETLTKLAQAAGPGGSTVALAGFLAKQWLCGETELTPYLEMLPRRGEMTHVLWWDEERVLTLEDEALEDARALRQEVALATGLLQKVLAPTVRRAAIGRGDLGVAWQCDELIREAVRRAFACLLSRSFSYELGEGSEREETAEAAEAAEPAKDADPAATAAPSDAEQEASGETLVPMLDMLQHGAVPSVRHRKEAAPSGEQLVVVRARRDLTAGHELLNQYLDPGAPTHVWLTRFGFIPEEELHPEKLLFAKEFTALPSSKGFAE